MKLYEIYKELDYSKSRIVNDLDCNYWIYKVDNVIVKGKKFAKIYLFDRLLNNDKLNFVTFKHNGRTYNVSEFSMVSQYNNQNIIGCNIEIPIDDLNSEFYIEKEIINTSITQNSRKNYIEYSYLGFPVENEYLKEKNQNYKNIGVVYPQINKKFWQCCCGRIHSNDENSCRCSLTREDNNEILNFDVEGSKISDYARNLSYDYKKTFEQNITDIKNNFEKNTGIDCNKLLDKIILPEEEDSFNNKKTEIDKNIKHRKKIILITAISIVSISVLSILVYFTLTFLIPEYKYKMAQEMLDANQFEEAILSLEKLNYKDSEVKAKQAKYDYGCYCLDNGDIEKAYEIIENLESKNYKGYEDTLKKVRFLRAESLFKEKKYKEAADIMDVTQKTFSEDKRLRNNIYYEYAKYLYEKNNLEDAYKYLFEISDPTIFEDYGNVKDSVCFDYGNECYNKNEYEQAISALEKLEKKDNNVNQLINDSKYKYVNTHKDNKNIKTYNYLKDLKTVGYKNVDSIYKELYTWKATVIINNSETDETTDKQSVARYSTWYCHVKTEGGIPGQTINLKYTTSWPNSSPLNGKLEGLKDGSTSWCSFWYTDYGTYGGTGTFKINIYTESGIFLCSDSVSITR